MLQSGSFAFAGGSREPKVFFVNAKASIELKIIAYLEVMNVNNF
jgi:hypothetical protein